MFHKPLIALLFTLLLLSTSNVWAKQDNNKIDINAFAELPIMHEGRIKPIDSFARSLRKQLSGKDNKAALWLAETLFNPAAAENIPSLRISNPDLLNMLELEKQIDKLYSYKEVMKSLDAKQDVLKSIIKTPRDKWTKAQGDFITLQENAVLLGNLLSSMALFLPLSITLPDNVPETLRPYSNKSLSYSDVIAFNDVLQQEVKNTVKNKGDDIEKYNEAEQIIAYLSFNIANMQNSGQHSKIFKTIPVNGKEEWLSPWQISINKDIKAKDSNLMPYWQSLAIAFHNKNNELWNTSIENIKSTMETEYNKNNALQIEYFYNSTNPFYISILFYSFALLLLIISPYIKKDTIYIASLSLWVGAGFHLSGIMARIYILERPPVSTLYESIIFVGLIAVLYGLIAYRGDRAKFWLIISAGAGVSLHLLAFSHDQDGDSMMMLSAVLNTNFWLATHVITITIGYAFCLITSIIAHYALIAMTMGKYNDALFKHIHKAALLALLFSTIGTVLGGIWADQSWGRFWGWDPKENGALLIVLWLIWILHGRISGQMKNPAVIAGLAYLSVIVALSWFGVNLLSVGLHAYGFTNSMLWSFIIFIGVDTLIILGLYIAIINKFKQKGRNNPALL